MSAAAQPKAKTVPFPGAEPKKEVPTVTMHPVAPLVDKFLVPVAWVAFGVFIGKVLWKSKEKHAAPAFAPNPFYPRGI